MCCRQKWEQWPRGRSSAEYAQENKKGFVVDMGKEWKDVRKHPFTIWRVLQFRVSSSGSILTLSGSFGSIEYSLYTVFTQ
jgi:hypothetical protein